MAGSSERPSSERPSFEPHEQPVRSGSVPGEPVVVPVGSGRDPLRAVAPFFVTLAAIGVTALAVWLPVREAQHESLQHYESTRYLDVRPGAVFAWHDVQWQMTSMRQIPWQYYNGASPPPKGFVRFRIVLHPRLLGPKAKFPAPKVEHFLSSGIGGSSFGYELRDRDDRSWRSISTGTEPQNWPAYKPANGIDLTIYADAPAGKAGEVTLTVKINNSLMSVDPSKTPGPRKTVLRFVR